MSVTSEYNHLTNFAMHCGSFKYCRSFSKPHGAPHVPCVMFGHVDDNWMFHRIITLSGVCIFKIQHIPSEFDHRSLEAQTDSQERLLVDATPATRVYFALHSPLAEASWHYHTTRKKNNPPQKNPQLISQLQCGIKSSITLFCFMC